MAKLTKAFITFANQVFDEVYRKYNNTTVDDGNYQDLVINAARKLKRKIKNSSSGMYRTAFIFDAGVIKVTQGDASGAHRLVDETNYIQKMRRNRKIAKHFPDTEVIHRVKRVGTRKVNIVIQVQETVKNIDNWRLVNKWGDYVYKLGTHLGISDVHSANYGWAGPKGREYPVFVDVDFRARPRKPVKRPSWAP
jgi:hypothetical protein